MTDLAKVRVALTNWPGAPGVNTLYFSPGTSGWAGWTDTVVQDLVDEVHTAFSGRHDSYISGVKIDIETDVQIIDHATGDLVGVTVAPTAPAQITGDGGSSAMSRGACLNLALITSDFLSGRRIQGRLYIGPICSGMFDTNGYISSGAAATWTSAFSGMISGTGPRLCVWRRPKPSSNNNGAYGDVTSVVGRVRPSYLKSRVD